MEATKGQMVVEESAEQVLGPAPSSLPRRPAPPLAGAVGGDATPSPPALASEHREATRMRRARRHHRSCRSTGQGTTEGLRRQQEAQPMW